MFYLEKGPGRGIIACAMEAKNGRFYTCRSSNLLETFAQQSRSNEASQENASHCSVELERIVDDCGNFETAARGWEGETSGISDSRTSRRPKAKIQASRRLVVTAEATIAFDIVAIAKRHWTFSATQAMNLPLVNDLFGEHFAIYECLKNYRLQP